MAAGLKLWDASGNNILDTADRVAGDSVLISTGTANGSHTAVPKAGQNVEFVYNYPGSWLPAGTASPWPVIAVSGNTISWSFSPAASAGRRFPVNIMVVIY